MRPDPLIIGGGPAGSAAAITLARAGHRPILLERASGPTDKVCGDFLSTDTIQAANALGIDPLALGASPINRMRLIHRERVVETDLPFPACGLSRRTLDAALLHQAQKQGADVQPGQTVRRLQKDNGHWTIQTANQTTFHADTVFLATGKHDLRDVPRPHGKHDAVGMKMYFALRPDAIAALTGAIELTLFPGGYAGLQLVENQQAVLCIAIQRHAFQSHGNWNRLITTIGQHSRRFAAILQDAQPLLPKPLAIAGVPYGYQANGTPAQGLFQLGDQAAVIPSLTGDGMAIALHSGQTAGRLWLGGGDALIYQRAISATLAPQMRLAGLLHHACLHGGFQPTAIRVAEQFPALLRYAARRTRVRVAPRRLGSGFFSPTAAVRPGIL